MFEEATIVEKTGSSSDLIPFWGLRQTDDMVKIERIVPMYPFSRDGLAYERLIKILSLYRLTLGQAIFNAFADKSVAGQESISMDEKTFGDIISEEIERIKEKNKSA